jgi:hypothetical protein
MKTMIGILAGLVLATGACRQSDENRGEDQALPRPIERVDPVPAPAPTETPPAAQTEPGAGANASEPDGEFVAARDTWGDSAKERLDRIEARIAELETRADETSREHAARLRAKQDELRTRLGTLQEQVKAGWTSFKEDLQRNFDELDHELDQAYEPDPAQ